MINEATNKVLNNQDLSFTECREVFDEIFSGLGDEIQSSSFLTALKSKKETQDEITAAILSSKEAIKKPFINIINPDTIENINLADENDFINISLLQDIICCAHDLNVCRYKFNNSTNTEKSFKILELMGANFNKEHNINSVDFEKLNFSYITLDENSPYIKYSEKLQRTMKFNTILDTTSKLLNPLNSKNIFIATNDKNKVNLYANIALKLNYENSIIVSGGNNFPYISIQDESFIAEAWKNKIFTYVATPDLFGFESASLDEIKCNSIEHNKNCIEEILKNNSTKPLINTALMNAGLSLYISKKTDSLMNGIELAKQAIETGLAWEKLQQIIKFYS